MYAAIVARSVDMTSRPALVFMFGIIYDVSPCDAINEELAIIKQKLVKLVTDHQLEICLEFNDLIINSWIWFVWEYII